MRNFLIYIVLLSTPLDGLADELVTAPDWTLKSINGEPVTLSAVTRERPTILFFWASWCPYCKALMPHLQSILLEYGADVEILAVNFREDGDAAKFRREAGYGFTLIPDGDDVARAYGVWATPGLLIVDRERRVHFDLRDLPRRELPRDASNHRRKAAFRAPYWAARIRESLDSVLAQDDQAENP